MLKNLVPDSFPNVSPTLLWVGGAVVTLLVGLVILVRILNFLEVRRRVFRPGGVGLDKAASIPNHQRPMLEKADQELQELGFRFWGTLRDGSMVGDQHPRWLLVYEQGSPPTLARVALALEPYRLRECDVVFTSWRQSDGRYVETLSQPVSKALPVAEDSMAEGRVFASLADQWKAHQARVQPIGAEIAFPDAQAWVARADAHGRGDLRRLVALNKMKPGREPGTYRLRWGAAWKMAGEVGKVEGEQLVWARRNRQSAPVYPPSILAELDMDHWHREESWKASAVGASGWMKLAMLLLSMVLSGWAMKGGALETNGVLAILGVLMVHELGHFLAMWLFGYRNLGIFFIPFFGAVAMAGKRPDVAAWKEIIVVLAGPVPGMVAGAVALLYDCWGIEWLRWPAFFSLILNGLNLLPVLPMDGGHLLRLAIQGRWPRLQALLQTLSALGMMGMGLFGGKVLLYIGISQLLHLGTPWFVANVVRRKHRSFAPVQGSRKPHAEEDAYREAYRSIREHPRYRAKHGVVVQSLATQIADQLKAKQAGFFATAFAILGCTVVLWSPVAAWFGVGAYAERQIVVETRKNFEAGLPANPQDARRYPACEVDPVNRKRWTALIKVVSELADDSPAYQALREMDKDRFEKEPEATLADEAKSALTADDAPMLEVWSPALPAEVPPALDGFLNEVRLALVAEPKNVSQTADVGEQRFQVDALALLRRDARRQLRAGNIKGWKDNLIACARGVEAHPYWTTTDCELRSIATQQLIAVIEEAWPQLGREADAPFLEDLVQRLPTPDELIRCRVLSLFTDSTQPTQIGALNGEGEDAIVPDRPLVRWIQQSPPARLLEMYALRHRRELWLAATSPEAADWQKLCGNFKLQGATMPFMSPEVIRLVSLSDATESCETSLRPQWQIFLAAAKLQGAKTTLIDKLAANCSERTLGDGARALIFNPPAQKKQEGTLSSVVVPQPVIWRLSK